MLPHSLNKNYLILFYWISSHEKVNWINMNDCAMFIFYMNLFSRDSIEQTNHMEWTKSIYNIYFMHTKFAFFHGVPTMTKKQPLIWILDLPVVWKSRIVSLIPHELLLLKFLDHQQNGYKKNDKDIFFHNHKMT